MRVFLPCPSWKHILKSSDDIVTCLHLASFSCKRFESLTSQFQSKVAENEYYKSSKHWDYLRAFQPYVGHIQVVESLGKRMVSLLCANILL